MNADNVALLIVHDRPSNLVGKRPRRASPRPRGNNRFESGAKLMTLTPGTGPGSLSRYG